MPENQPAASNPNDLTQISEHWDAVIIGAGPAGAMAACLLAQQSARVLLVDKSSFPRPKVCGCCINAAAVNILETQSLAYILDEQGAVPLQNLQIFEQGKTAKIALPGGFALSRNRFDYALIQAAIERGVTFMPETSALAKDAGIFEREVLLQQQGDADSTRSARSTCSVGAKIVLVADGIGGHSLSRMKDFDFVTETNSRFGCSTIVDDGPGFYETGSIYMVCGHGGYVGLVRLEDGRLDIAAALDRDFSKRHSGPGGASINILQGSNMPVPELLYNAHWSGTEALTRKRKQIANERIFVIGDACGYAEPFTGEGISWALASAVGAADLSRQALDNWSDSLARDWAVKHKQLLKHRQKRSIFIAHALRRDAVRRFVIPAIASFPSVANFIAQKVSTSGVVTEAHFTSHSDTATSRSHTSAH
jgi:menaquinone-9 beta-reductase